ncbi:GntR family transcriptional regulator [Corallococcus coralloides DSM 2259]|uniref:GntR family transcriptional regulator n=1 Tax=Corallococcus coralloides (strain ATCC 25202 / DSM 2259 / NBRC 100086 / M2) TaxID=1144275 RepID=H8MYK9_CORCM|nr:GntR family transcriptional regulator [Corallococcus coralloides]AFE04196.1 GntR family transcriptional regulator [Corallococcus coralloides DSM 2259]
MGMGREGLVAYVEAQIERDIALGRLHPSGQFGSEAKLARRYEVCRGTIREALRRLAARGLVVQHPGRKTRAVPLDESLTLENLGLALHDARSPDARWLLEGYFSLKRQVLVEVLVDCCTRASVVALDQLSATCFKLQDAARWESGALCAQVEFELLRLAARVAERPGHVLLVQSLQRAFLGVADRLQPLMGGESLREWAWYAMRALGERDARALQNELPALLQACDERLLAAFAPASQKRAPPEAPRAQEERPAAPASAPAQVNAMEVRPGVEERGLGCPAPAVESSEALGVDSCLQEHGFHVEQARGTLLSPAAIGLVPCEPGGACAGNSMGATLGNVSGCRTGPGALGSEERLLPMAPTMGSRGFSQVAVHTDGGPLHDGRGPLGRWAARLWRFIAITLGLPAE